jgi:hypothetical protein
MRIHHVLAASAAALLAIPSWAQSSPVFDPTGSVWLGEQIAAARRSASSEASAPARRPVARGVVSKKDDAPKTAELDRPGRVTQVGAAATAP